MKIGILTLPLHTNYGGILQAWALQKTLSKLKYNSIIINSPISLQKIPWLVIIKRILLKISGKNISVPIFHEIERKYKKRKIESFVRNNIVFKKYYSLEEIGSKEYDAIIVGSDQIWRKEYFRNGWPDRYLNMFLSFTNNWKIKRIAYAASFGTDDWQFNLEESAELSKILSLFDLISVREKSAVNMLKKNTGIESKLVLDPTMLLSKEEYVSWFGIKNTDSKQLVSYILDPIDEINYIIDSVSESMNLKRKELNKANLNKSLYGVKEWISSIANASLVITNSFHGCVFSIIFNRPLIFFGNKNRGNTRFDTLIDTFGIYSNYVQDLNLIDLNKDYSLNIEIQDILFNLRQYSLDYLKGALN